MMTEQGVRRSIYEGRVSRLVNRYFFSLLDCAFAPDASEPLAYPPVFILGAPRSGSTLLMQVIKDAFDFGYLSNLHSRWFGCPALAERFILDTPRAVRSNYRSEHGTTSSGYEPAECGQWWYRFFRRHPAYIFEAEIDTAKMRRFRQSLAALTNAFGRPLIFKNLYASFRINAIARFVPEAIFITISRNIVENGHSILEGRYKVFGDYGHWWSMEPPNIGELKALPPHQQVIEQVRQIRSIIDSDLKENRIPLTRRFEVQYEDFCDDPGAIIDELNKFFIANQCPVSRKNYTPTPFKIRNTIRIDEELYRAMALYASKA